MGIYLDCKQINVRDPIASNVWGIWVESETSQHTNTNLKPWPLQIDEVAGTIYKSRPAPTTTFSLSKKNSFICWVGFPASRYQYQYRLHNSLSKKTGVV